MCVWLFDYASVHKGETVLKSRDFKKILVTSFVFTVHLKLRTKFWFA